MKQSPATLWVHGAFLIYWKPVKRYLLITLGLVAITGACALALAVMAVNKRQRSSSRPPLVNLSLHKSLTSLWSPEGKRLLRNSEINGDYELMAFTFEAQVRANYCGVASSVAALNLVFDPGDGRITQDTFFDISKVSDIRTEKQVTDAGMSLGELHRLLEAHGAHATVHRATPGGAHIFRKHLQENLQDPRNVTLVNYLRQSMHQQSGGHISPLGAYDVTTDKVLVMDVAVHKYPPVWVKVDKIYDAMVKKDLSTGKRRGYVEVSNTDPSQGT